MYELGVERKFSATHAITMEGKPERSHRHDWHVRVVVSGREVDGEGLLVDFHLLEMRLDEIVAPFRERDLNTVAPFDGLNPTAELLARHIADRMTGSLPAGVAVTSVSVMEAPGCTATYRPA